MSQVPGGAPLGTERIDFTGNTAPLEAAAAKAVEVTKAGAAAAQAAVNSAGGLGGAGMVDPAPIQEATEKSKGLVGSLNEVRKSALSVTQAFFGWTAILGIVATVAGVVGKFLLDTEKSFTKMAKASEEASRKIEDPLLKSLDKLKNNKDSTLKLNFVDANDAVSKLPKLQEELDGLLTQMGPLENFWDWVKSDDETLQKRIDRVKELQDAIKRGTAIGNRAGEEERRIRKEEEAETAREMGDAAVKLFAEEAKKKNDLDTALVNELIQKKRAAEDAALEGIDLINQQERRAFEELEALKARDTEGRFTDYIQEAYIATRKEYDFKRQKHAEEEEKKREDRRKEDAEITRRIEKEAKQRDDALNKSIGQLQQAAANLVPTDKISVQLDQLTRVMERVASNTKNIAG